MAHYQSVPKIGATFAEILAEIKKKELNYPAGNLTFYLNELQKDIRGSVIRHNSTSGKYSFSDPIFLAYAILLFKQGNISVSVDKASILDKADLYIKIAEIVMKLVLR